MKCLWQAEIDRQCRSVLARHWPAVTCYDDVRRVRAYLEPRHAKRKFVRPERPDVLCGGFPCQDLSVAGRRAGLAGERSGLWFTFRRIAALLRPGWLLIENVDGLRSSNGGRDLGIILRALGDMGYGWAYRVFDSQWFGLAQRRERVFIVGSLGSRTRAAEILFESDCLPWDSPPSRSEGEATAACLTSGAHPGGHNGQDDTKDGRLIVGTLAVSRQELDRVVPIDMRQASRGGRFTNNRPGGSSGGAPGIGIGSPGDPAFTCCESHPQAIAFDTTQITSPGNYSVPKAGGPCHPLASNAHPAAVAYRTSGNCGVMEQGDKTAALNCATDLNQNIVAFQTRIARNGRGQPKEITDALTSCEGGTHADSKPHIAGVFGVRRLTPLEYERLQGFPDDWTRWDADGNELADSPRYRMMGNAVSIPPVFWIGRRIVEASNLTPARES